MRRRLRTLAVLLGVVATGVGLVLAIRRFEPTTPGAGPGTLVWLVGLGGLAAAAWLLYDHTRTRSRTDPVPWSDAGPIVRDAPEAVPQERPLSGGDLAAALVEAGVAARRHREIEHGVAVVRPLLREAYVEAAVAGGADRAAATADLDGGTWTDDPVAASVCSASVDPPPRSLRRRVRDWLYPGRAVTRRTVRAVSAVTDAADDLLPAVIGSDEPRRIQTYEPSLAVRDVGGDGRVRAATRRQTAGRGDTDDDPAAAESEAAEDGVAEDEVASR